MVSLFFLYNLATCEILLLTSGLQFLQSATGATATRCGRLRQARKSGRHSDQIRARTAASRPGLSFHGGRLGCPGGDRAGRVAAHGAIQHARIMSGQDTL